MMMGIAIIPLLYGGLLTASYQDPIGRLDHIQAAVVNQDVPVTVASASGAEETIDLGGSLTEALINPADSGGAGFSWTAMDSEEADQALADGGVLAVLTIPADLSEGMGVLAEGEAPQGLTPQLDLVTDDGTSYLVGNLASQVAATLQQQVTTQAAESYINGLLLSMKTVQEGLREGADGTSALLEGIDTLHKGANTLATGASTAANGAQNLDAGASSLATGARQLEDGAASVSQGTQVASASVAQLNAGLQSLLAGATSVEKGTLVYTQGVQDAAEGAASLAAGASSLNDLSSAVDSYTGAVDMVTANMPELASAAGAVSDGADALDQGVRQLSVAVGPSDAPADPGSQQLVPATKAYVDGVRQVNGALNAPQVTAASAAITESWPGYEGAMGQLSDALVQMSADCGHQTDPSSEICQQLAVEAAQATSLSDTTILLGAAATGIAQVVTQTGYATSQLSVSGDKLEAGTTSIAQKIGTGPTPADQTLLSGASQLASGADQLSSRVGAAGDSAAKQIQGGQTPTLVGILNDLSRQSGQLRAGASASTQVATGAAQVSNGLNQIAGRSSELTTGTQQVTSGTTQLAAGSSEMNAKIGDLASGASTLASASTQVANGSATLAEGVPTLSAGVGALSNGASSLATGVGSVSVGTQELQAALEEGADTIPVQTEEQHAAAAERAAHIATIAPVRDNAVINNGAGFLPMFMSLALWVGCIALFLVYPALKPTARGESWWKAATRTLPVIALVSVAQALLLVLVVNWSVGIETVNLAALCAMAVLASFVFMLINQACIATMGFVGRFVSLVLIVLQIASMGATFPIQTAPLFFQWIHPWLPMTYSQLAFRALIAGGSTTAVSNALFVLGLWGVASLILTFIAAEIHKDTKNLVEESPFISAATANG